MNDILISVIIPIWNTHAEQLKRCISSILMQENTVSTANNSIRVEIIAVIDGTADKDILAILESDSRITTIIKQHEGVAAARNRGLSRASGSWIAFADSDDYYFPNSFALLLSEAIQAEADIVFGNHARIYGSHRDNIIYTGKKNQLKIDKEECISRILSPGTDQGTVWAKLFRKSLLSNNGIEFDKSLSNGEDQEFLVRLVSSTSSFAAINDVCYAYVYNPNSTVRSYQPDAIKRCEVTIKRLQKDCLLCLGTQSEKKIMADYCLDRLLTLLINYVCHPQSKHTWLQKRRLFRELRHTNYYRDALKLGNYKSFPFSKRVFLYCAKWGLFTSISIIAQLRHCELHIRSHE